MLEKDEARFECEVSRDAKSFRWLKGSQEVKTDEKFEILQEEKRHILVVKSAAYEDEAKYMFEAEDKRTTGKLIIQGMKSLFLWKVIKSAYYIIVKHEWYLQKNIEYYECSPVIFLFYYFNIYLRHISTQKSCLTSILRNST